MGFVCTSWHDYPSTAVTNSATSLNSESHPFFGLLWFMSLLPFSSLTNLNSKDNSHHNNERKVPILFLFFGAEVLSLHYIEFNHPAKTLLPWCVWGGQNVDCSLLKAQAHFSHFWELGSGWGVHCTCPTPQDRGTTCWAVPAASGKRLWARDWRRSAEPGRLQHLSWLLKHNHDISCISLAQVNTNVF